MAKDKKESERTALVVLTPPKTLASPQELTEAEKMFLAENPGTPEPVRKFPFITIDHKRECFVLPSGETIDGHDGLCGFFIAHYTNRAYYEKAFDPKADKVPPDCKSADCITPDKDVLNPVSKECAGCPMNAFGTAKQGKGKACKEKIWLFMVNPEFGNPPLATLILPSSSIGRFYGGMMKRGYFDQLRAKSPAWQVIWNKITLNRENENDAHVMPTFEMGGMAEMDVARSLVAISKTFADAIRAARHETAPVDKEDVA